MSDSYPKALLAVTGELFGLKRPYLADLPTGQRCVATDGYAMVAVPAHFYTGDGSPHAPDPALLWSRAIRIVEDGRTDWPDLVSRAKIPEREARAANKAALDEHRDRVRPIKTALSAARASEKAVRARLKGKRSIEATDERRRAYKRTTKASDDYHRIKRPPVEKTATVPIYEDGPHVQARYIRLVDRALQSAGVIPAYVRCSPGLDPIVVFDHDDESAALIMPWRMD